MIWYEKVTMFSLGLWCFSLMMKTNYLERRLDALRLDFDLAAERK